MTMTRNLTKVGAIIGSLLLWAGCTVELKGDSKDGVGGGTGQTGLGGGAGTGGAGGAGGATKVEQVSTIGVGVTADTFCSTGAFTVTILPQSDQGGLVPVGPTDVTCTASLSGQNLTCAVNGVNCVSGSGGASQTAVLIIMDESSSMDTNDPEAKRSEACVSFVNQLNPTDVVLLADFGNGGVSPASALRTVQAFTADKDLARAACQKATTGSWGTPIYGSVVDAAEVFLPMAEQQYGANVNFSVLMLTDGEPASDTANREQALAAARTAQVPIYTVGLGPAAEGSSSSNATAIGVLQELSQETQGAYASSVLADGLTSLFQHMGTAVRQGKCQVSATLTASQFAVGGSVQGTITNQSLTTTYGFTVPTSTLAESKCQ